MRKIVLIVGILILKIHRSNGDESKRVAQREIEEMFANPGSLVWKRDLLAEPIRTEVGERTEEGWTWYFKQEEWRPKDAKVEVSRTRWPDGFPDLGEAPPILKTLKKKIESDEIKVLSEDEYEVDGKKRYAFLLFYPESGTIEWRLHIFGEVEMCIFSIAAKSKERFRQDDIKELLRSIK